MCVPFARPDALCIGLIFSRGHRARLRGCRVASREAWRYFLDQVTVQSVFIFLVGSDTFPLLSYVLGCGMSAECESCGHPTSVQFGLHCGSYFV